MGIGSAIIIRLLVQIIRHKGKQLNFLTQSDATPEFNRIVIIGTELGRIIDQLGMILRGMKPETDKLIFKIRKQSHIHISATATANRAGHSRHTNSKYKNEKKKQESFS